jgi:hypothetical protein
MLVGNQCITVTFTGGKRQLQPSHRTTAWLLWPFALWGIILVALYMAAYQSIANISSPLATLNIVNFVAIRFTRTIFFAQQLAWEQGAAAKAAGRSAMQASIGPLILNYEAMLYGASVSEDRNLLPAVSGRQSLSQPRSSLCPIKCITKGLTWLLSALLPNRACLARQAPTSRKPRKGLLLWEDR